MNKSEPGEILAEGKYLRLLRKSGWEWAERTNTSGAVVISAVTVDRRMVFTEQYRVPVDARVLDLPAGLAGDDPQTAREELVEAARRELLEETGCEAPTMEYLTEGPSSAGLSNEILTFFLARDVRRIGPGGGDAKEEIEVHLVPLDDVDAWLEAKRRSGILVDPKTYTAPSISLDGPWQGRLRRARITHRN